MGPRKEAKDSRKICERGVLGNFYLAQPPHNTIPSHLLLWDSRPPLRSNERTNTGISKASLHLVSGSLQLITENGREGISAASVHARILPSKSKWFIKKYNLYTNCLALPTCAHVDLRTSSRLYSFHSYLAAISLLMLPSVRVTALCPFLLYG